MAASVLSSPIAVAASIAVVRAFVALRKWLSERAESVKRVDGLERQFTDHDDRLKAVFEAIRDLLIQSNDAEGEERIGFRQPAGESQGSVTK